MLWFIAAPPFRACRKRTPPSIIRLGLLATIRNSASDNVDTSYLPGTMQAYSVFAGNNVTSIEAPLKVVPCNGRAGR
jgi:hypothetical protein